MRLQPIQEIPSGSIVRLADLPGQAGGEIGEIERKPGSRVCLFRGAAGEVALPDTRRAQILRLPDERCTLTARLVGEYAVVRLPDGRVGRLAKGYRGVWLVIYPGSGAGARIKGEDQVEVVLWPAEVVGDWLAGE